MTGLHSSGEDASLTLESDIGTINIKGETLMSTFDKSFFEMADSSILQQGTALYSWEGEETTGLIERCTLRENIQAS